MQNEYPFLFLFTEDRIFLKKFTAFDLFSSYSFLCINQRSHGASRYTTSKPRNPSSKLRSSQDAQWGPKMRIYFRTEAYLNLFKRKQKFGWSNRILSGLLKKSGKLEYVAKGALYLAINRRYFMVQMSLFSITVARFAYMRLGTSKSKQ